MSTTKIIYFLRHGQALHNPRAEEAKRNGCSHSKFLHLMQEDDAFDACLTPLGESQAIKAGETYSKNLDSVELVVSSPLSRTIQTANLAIPPSPSSPNARRICVEHFREINGWLLNAKRRARDDLDDRFNKSDIIYSSPSQKWDFSQLPEEDETWTETLETEESCAERGYKGLLWLKDRPEDNILTVTHGGLLRFIANHCNIQIMDQRPNDKKRFQNCELRGYHMTWTTDTGEETVSENRPLVTLNEIQISNCI